jgi:hypothetical protein
MFYHVIQSQEAIGSHGSALRGKIAQGHSGLAERRVLRREKSFLFGDLSPPNKNELLGALCGSAVKILRLFRDSLVFSG